MKLCLSSQGLIFLVIPSLVLSYTTISPSDPGLVYSGRFDFGTKGYVCVLPPIVRTASALFIVTSAPSYDWSGVEILVRSIL